MLDADFVGVDAAGAEPGCLVGVVVASGREVGLGSTSSSVGSGVEVTSSIRGSPPPHAASASATAITVPISPRFMVPPSFPGRWKQLRLAVYASPTVGWPLRRPAMATIPVGFHVTPFTDSDDSRLIATHKVCSFRGAGPGRGWTARVCLSHVRRGLVGELPLGPGRRMASGWCAAAVTGRAARGRLRASGLATGRGVEGQPDRILPGSRAGKPRRRPRPGWSGCRNQ